MIRRGFPYEWISNIDIRMDIPGGSRAIVSVTGVSSGKRYAEVVWDSFSNSAPDRNYIGITPISGAAVSPRAGGIGFQNTGSIYVLDVLIQIDGPTPITGDVGNLAIDCATGKVWIGNNGTWYAGGDPGAGTGQTDTLALDTYYVGASTSAGAAGVGAKFSLRTQTSQFTGSIPSGFSAWYP